MKKFLTLVVALVMVLPMMAKGRNDGSTKANAIDFDWEAQMEHSGGTKWYVVNLDPLYEEETPALNLFLANKGARDSAHVSLRATVAGQTDEKHFNIAPKQQRVWSANATMLIRLKQKEIYLTLTSDGPVQMSARVFEAADLDETCQDATWFNWNTGITQSAGVAIWHKVHLEAAKANTEQDVCVIVTNEGTGPLTLHAGQSLDCPSSGVTKRTIELPVHGVLRDTIPHSMIASVAFNDLYVSLENDQPITVRAEYADRPPVPVMPDALPGIYTDTYVPDTALHKNDTMVLNANQEYYLRYTVQQLNALKKYEPEFTFRNISAGEVSIERKMAFVVPAYVAQGNTLTLAEGEESIEVLSKNTLIGLEAMYIYIKIKADKDIQLISRFKHLREGKACKTNIDFNWDGGHRQEATTTQWYAIDLTQAKETQQDVVVYVNNTSASKATIGAALAFSCPYIDLQEISRPIAAGDTLKHRMAYSTYAMMTDTVWASITTNQEIKFWAEMVPTQKKAEVDTICMNAVDFNWDEGAMQHAGDTVWYLVDMQEVREKAAKFPTVFVQNLNSTAEVKITAELSLECPDSIENQKRSITIAANGSYSRQLARNMFENIKKDTIYLRVISTQDISLQIRLTEEAEGASCSSAVPFNWVSGNSQPADANVWYAVDLREVMKNGNDIRLHIKNNDKAQCKGLAQLLYECPSNETPSIQNFKLGANEEQKITIQNSAFEMVDDSAVYVNLQANTSVRFWVEILPVEAFDTITADGLTLIPLLWDSLYTQNVDTAWYIIPKSEIDKVRNLDEKVKPVVHAINKKAANLSIKGEAAFAFPITKKMMAKTQELKANQHYTDTIPAGTFDQFLKKDSVIIRITRPGSGEFQFRAELVKAFSGNTRNDALKIRLGERYTQGPNTEMWYRLNTVDIKNDKTLFNKALWVSSKNAGQNDATVNVSIYEGLMSEVDLLEEYGLAEYRERTIKKGEDRARTIPAQAVYAVGDMDMFIKVRTTDSLVFETKFNGEYAPQAPDPNQRKAKLVVPNVEYIIPADTTCWYLVCIPYIQNNYIYVDSSRLEYEFTGPITIESTATFQDTMDCKMPVRKRTINRTTGYHKGSRPLRELIEKGIKKAGYTFDFEGTAPEFMDSLLHRYITKDSITGYVRIKTDKEMKFKLVTPQITGDACTNPMEFDWEHGNVNPADSTTWYHVDLDSLIIPDTCDLRLHVDNWSAESDTVEADLYFDCLDPATKTKGYKLAGNGKDSLDIDRDFLEQLGWADMLINFKSDKATHIWAELIPNIPRDTLRDTIVAYVCQGGSYTDTITNITYDPIDTYTQWYDTVEFQDGVLMKDSITWFRIYPLVTPEALTVDSMKNLGAAPILVQGMQLFVDSSSVKLTEYYRNLGDTVDTIIKVDTVYWAKPVYKASGDLNDKTEAPLVIKEYTKDDTQDTLLLVIRGGECGFIYRTDIKFPIDAYKYVDKSDTLCPPIPAKPDTTTYTVADIYGLPRKVDTVTNYVALVMPTLLTQAEVLLLPEATQGDPIDTTYTISSLLSQFAASAGELTMGVTDAYWQAYDGTAWQDMPYTVPMSAATVTMRYIITTDCNLNDTSANFTINTNLPPCSNDTIKMPTPIIACDSYHWDISGQDYAEEGEHYYYFAGNKISGTTCDTIYELHLIINKAVVAPYPLEGCDSVVYKGVKYTNDTLFLDTLLIPTVTTGCDSILMVAITINHAVITPYPLAGCDSVIYKGVKYTEAASFMDTLLIPAANGCDSILMVDITINQPYDSVTNAGLVENSYYWPINDSTYTETPAYGADTMIVAGQDGQCDSTYILIVTIYNGGGGECSDTTIIDPLVIQVCDSFVWASTAIGDTIIKTSGTYTRVFKKLDGCDSIVTKTFEVNYRVDTILAPDTVCGKYDWVEADTTIINSGTYTHLFQTVAGCDSTVTLTLTVNAPRYEQLPAVAKYNNRLLVINRDSINKMEGWENVLDSLNLKGLVKWYKMVGATPDVNADDSVGRGYYYHNEELTPLVGSYYAYVYREPEEGGNCEYIGQSKVLECAPTSASAPALVPSLALPGQDIQVINLDPNTETLIRIYTAEGLLQKTYTSVDAETFTIKAANDHGFYLVELVADSMKTTLRYIVK